MAKKIGRPIKAAPADAAERIEALSVQGHSILNIAVALGTGKDTLNRWMEEDPGLREALNKGRAQQEFKLHNKLYEMAMGGNVTAAIYLTKARFGWREGEPSESANRVSINFTLPGAMKPEHFTIENDPRPKP